MANCTITYERASTNFDDIAAELIETLRIKSDLSYVKCVEFAQIVVETITDRAGMADLIPLRESLKKDLLDVENCYDAKKIGQNLKSISEWCRDHQERSWGVLEDETLLVDGLNELDDVLAKADRRVSIHVISDDDCTHLNDLVKLYQMEARTSVRWEALKTLKSICLLHPKFAPFLLSTVLPIELANEMAVVQSSKSVQNLAVEILTLLFCTGEQIPVALYDIFNVSFMQRILKRLKEENCPTFLYFLLAFNLHQAIFKHEIKTVVSAILESPESTKFFAENLLILVNTFVDPTWPYHNLRNPNDPSALVMMDCILHCKQSAQIFYQNDVMVLFHVLNREILNLPSSKVRTVYIKILLNLCRNVEDVRIEKFNDIRALLEHVKFPNFDLSEKIEPEDDDLLNQFLHLGFNT